MNKLTKLLTLIAIIFSLSYQNSYGQTKLKDDAGLKGFNNITISYFNSIGLKTENLLINDKLMNNKMTSLMNNIGTWQDVSKNIINQNSLCGLLNAQLNISVKNLAPVIADLANNNQIQESRSLFSALKNTFYFTKGACKAIASDFVSTIKQAPITGLFIYGIKFVNVPVQVGASLIMSALNICSQTKKGYKHGNLFLDSIYKGDYEAAGNHAAQLGMSAMSFKGIFKCGFKLYRLVKNKTYRNLFVHSLTNSFSSFKQFSPKLPEVTKENALNFECFNHQQLVLPGVKAHSIIVPGLKELVLPEKDITKFCDAINKGFKGKGLMTFDVANNHLFFPDIKCWKGQLIYNGLHANNKILESNLLNIQILKENLKNGVKEIGWNLGVGKIKPSTMFPAHWSPQKIAKSAIEAFNNLGKLPELQKSGNILFVGEDKEGIKISIVISSISNKIITIYAHNDNLE